MNLCYFFNFYLFGRFFYCIFFVFILFYLYIFLSLFSRVKEFVDHVFEVSEKLLSKLKMLKKSATSFTPNKISSEKQPI